MCPKCKALLDEYEDVKQVSLTSFEKRRLMRRNEDLFCDSCIAETEEDNET